VLQIDDIAVFVANWNSKIENLKHIQSLLNIGFDSMVFIDDNPFERNLVRIGIPEITVPDLPEDPADYLEYLYSLNLFETTSYSHEDAERTKQYKVEAQRNMLKSRHTSEDDFLKSLGMLSLVLPFNKYNAPRVAQLSQRSNQFNLRTIRYNEEEILALAEAKNYFTFSFTLEDRFGDNGLICVIILKEGDDQQLFIDSWFMSCRVINRGVENFALNTIVVSARAKGFKYLIGEYIPTAKNEVVKDHYKNLNFIKKGTSWVLDLSTFRELNCFINKKDNDTEQN
jgi:FkbH-like protein